MFFSDTFDIKVNKEQETVIFSIKMNDMCVIETTLSFEEFEAIKNKRTRIDQSEKYFNIVLEVNSSMKIYRIVMTRDFDIFYAKYEQI